MSPVYLLNCSVCEGEFCSKQKWLDHLTQDDHQKLARKETKYLINSDLSNSLKECCLVIFTTYDLTVPDAQKIVQYFGTRSQSTLVTDFVWWEDRPRIGIIQFESRKKVDEVLTRNEDTSSDGLVIDNQMVQFKRAVDMPDLELSALLPGNHKKPLTILESLPSRKRGRSESESQSEDLPPTSKKNCESSPPPHLPPSALPQDSSLHSQYLSIRKLVVIPDNLLSQATKAVSSLKASFSFNGPSAELAVFRTWYLNLSSTLSSSGSDDKEDLLVYLYRTISPPEFPSSYSWIHRERIVQFIHDIEKSPFPKDFTVLDKDPDDYTWRLMYTGGTSGGGPHIPIRLISHKHAMAEVQTCRIYKYMMTFDPRFEHVLSLLYFWTKVNGVTIGEGYLNRRNCHLSLPEPLSMQWLLMHFMCYRKYVPTVREIQNRPHPVLKERVNGIDIGFDEDPKFAGEWKLAHGFVEESSAGVENVLQLFLDFLQFCWLTLDGSSCIFNTKDGEVIKMEKFLSCEPATQQEFGWTTRMTPKEVKMLRKVDNGSADETNQYKSDMRMWNLYMVHPFVFNLKFSVCWDIRFVVKLMKVSEGKLRRFLNKIKCGGLESAEKRFGKLENALSVDKKIKEKIWSKRWV